MRPIDRIIIHCSATAEGRVFTAKDIDSWHALRGFRIDHAGKTYHIGYHYVIRLDGTVEQGRPEEVIGAHCLGFNKGSIGVCYIGGCKADGKTPADTRTPWQKDALLALLRKLRKKYPKAEILGHHDLNPHKACPSFDAKKEYAGI